MRFRTTDGNEYAVQFAHHYSRRSKQEQTVATLVTWPERHALIEVSTRQHPQDTPNRIVARTIALRKLNTAMGQVLGFTRKDRESFWNAVRVSGMKLYRHASARS